MAGPIRIAVTADATQANRTIAQTSTKAQKIGGAFKKAALPATAALGGLAVGAFKAAKAAAEDESAQRKLAQTLGKTGATKAQIKATEDYIGAQGKLYGTTDDELRPALAKLVVATKDVGEAQKLASLAQDIAAAKGLSLESVAAKLAKAQNGNVGALKSLGIQTQDSVKDSAALEAANIAVHKAQDDYNAALKKFGPNSNEAARAAEKLEYRQTKVGEAQGKVKKSTIDFAEAQDRLSKAYGGAAADAADTAAGKQKKLQVQMGELQEQIGAGLLPIMAKLAAAGLAAVDWISKNAGTAKILIGVIAGLAATILIVNGVMRVAAAVTAVYNGVTKAVAISQRLLNLTLLANPIVLIVAGILLLVGAFILAYKKSDKFRAIVDAAFSKVKAVAADVASFFTTKVPAAFGKITAAAGTVKDFLKKNWPLLLAILTGPFGLAVLAIVKNWDKIKTGAREAIRYVREKFDGLLGFFRDLPGKIGGFFSGLWDGIGNGLKDVLNSVLHLPLKIPQIDTHIPGVGKVGGQTLIPALANGGIVSRPTLALIGEAGPEAVVPLNRYNGGGGTTTINVNVYPAVGSSPFEIGREVRRVLDAYDGNGGRRRAV